MRTHLPHVAIDKITSTYVRSEDGELMEEFGDETGAKKPGKEEDGPLDEQIKRDMVRCFSLCEGPVRTDKCWYAFSKRCYQSEANAYKLHSSFIPCGDLVRIETKHEEIALTVPRSTTFVPRGDLVGVETNNQKVGLAVPSSGEGSGIY